MSVAMQQRKPRRMVVVETRAGRIPFGVVEGDEWQVTPGMIRSPVDAVDFLEDAVLEAHEYGAKWVKMDVPLGTGTTDVRWLMMRDLLHEGVRYFDSNGEDAIYYPLEWLKTARENA